MLLDRSRLAIDKRSVATVVPIGIEEHQRAIVIDDFFVDPDYVRQLALSLDYRATRGTFPGYDAKISLSTDEICERMSGLVDKRIQLVSGSRDTFVFSMMHEAFEPRLRHYPHPHVDYNDGKSAAYLAGLVYLNTPSQCRGGTSFYRHRETGIYEKRGDITAGLAHYMVKHQLLTVEDAFLKMQEHPEPMTAQLAEEWGYITDSNDTWERLALLEMRYNRFVLFDSRLFHNPYLRSGDFGHSLETRRLTMSLFFELPWEDASSP